MINTLKKDPARMMGDRSRLEKEVNRRLEYIKKHVRRFFEEDEFLYIIQNKEVADKDVSDTEKLQKWIDRILMSFWLSSMGLNEVWIHSYIETAYKKGIARAIQDARHTFPMQADITVTGLMAEPGFRNSLNVLKKKVSEYMYKYGVDLSTAANQAYMDGILAGESVTELKKKVLAILSKFEHRAKTIARTELTRAFAEAQLALFEHLSIKKVKVMAEWVTAGDDRVCPICLSMEGTISTLKEAHGLIPVHPNCLTGDSLIFSGSGISAISKRFYNGNITIFKTASGREFSCTPNHPILTLNGLVPADSLNIGSDVVAHGIRNGESFVDWQNINKPTTVEQICEAFINNGSMITVEVPVSAPDFHNDGTGSKVSIISTNSLLSCSLDAPISQSILNDDFIFGYVMRSLFNRLSVLTFGFPVMDGTSDSIMGSFNLFCSFIRSHKTPFEAFSLALGSENHIIFRQNTCDNRSAIFKHLGNGINGKTIEDVKLNNFSDNFFVDRILHKKTFQYNNYVYNVETPTLYYIANGIASHNCRCIWIPFVE